MPSSLPSNNPSSLPSNNPSSLPSNNPNSSCTVGTLNGASNKGSSNHRRQKKNSIESNEGNFFNLIKPSPIREYQPAIFSKASLAESSSHRRQGCRIQGNSHDSTLYYSLFKGSDVFFYLDIYLVTKTAADTGNAYT